MTMNAEHKDINTATIAPAYRQFWPWFLVCLPGSVVIASLVTLWIANTLDENEFIKGYQKIGLAVVAPPAGEKNTLKSESVTQQFSGELIKAEPSHQANQPAQP